MLFNMQTCIILQFEQNCSFCPVPQLPQVFGCPSFTPFDYIVSACNVTRRGDINHKTYILWELIFQQDLKQELAPQKQ